MSRTRALRIVLAGLVAYALSQAPTAAKPISMAKAPSWKEIGRLISEQKYGAALDGAHARLSAARQGGDEDEWARTLIKVVQLETGLHGYETAVRFLREQPWPKGPIPSAALSLFYAQSLITYAS